MLELIYEPLRAISQLTKDQWMSTFHHFALAVAAELYVDGYQQSTLVRLGYRPLIVRVPQIRPAMVTPPLERVAMQGRGSPFNLLSCPEILGASASQFCPLSRR